MNLNSIEEVEGYANLKVENKIRDIEKKLLKLSRMPYMIFAGVIFYVGVVSLTTENLESWITIIFIGALISVVDQKNIQRTELLKELFQLKYGK